MNLHDLKDPTKAITFATPTIASLDDLARLPRGNAAPRDRTPAADDYGASILATLGDGPLPADVSIAKFVKRDRAPERSGRKRTRRDRRAQGLSR